MDGSSPNNPLADFTAIAQAIVAAHQARDAFYGQNDDSYEALAVALKALTRRFRDAAYALAEVMPSPDRHSAGDQWPRRPERMTVE